MKMSMQPMITLVSGRYDELALKFNFGTLLTRHEGHVVQIRKDINRTSVVAFNKTFKDFENVWTGSDVSECFAQGNMDARAFSGLFSVKMVSELMSEGKASFAETKNDISFAYFNEENKPCGFSIQYFAADPTQWVISIIENTIAEPNQKFVTCFFSGKMGMGIVGNPILNGEIANPLISKAISTRTINRLLSNIILPEGLVNLEILVALKERINPGYNIDCCDLRKLQLNKFLDKISAIIPNSIELMQWFESVKKESKENLDFYKMNHFYGVLDRIVEKVQQVVGKNEDMLIEERNEIVYKTKLIQLAVKLEVESSKYKGIYEDRYKEASLLLEAKNLYAALDYPIVIFRELDFNESLENCFSLEQIEEAKYQMQSAAFDAKLLELSILASHAGNLYLQPSLIKIKSILDKDANLLSKEKMENSLSFINKLTEKCLEIVNFEGLLSTEPAPLNDASKAALEALLEIKNQTERLVIENFEHRENLEQLEETIMSEKRIFIENKLLQDRLKKFNGILNPDYLIPILNDVNQKTEGRLGDRLFLGTPAFYAVAKTMSNIENYTAHLNNLQDQLEKYLQDFQSNELAEKARLMLAGIENVVRTKPDLISKMSQLFECCLETLIAPNNTSNNILFLALAKKSTVKCELEAFSIAAHLYGLRKELQPYQNSLDPQKSKVYEAGQLVLNTIQDMVNKNRSLISKVPEIVKCCKDTLKDPTNELNNSKLLQVAKECVTKKSNAWKKLDAVLLMFAGALMALAGVVFVWPTFGASLAVTIASPLAFAKGQSLWEESKEKNLSDSTNDLKKEMIFFKTRVNPAADTDSDLGSEQGLTPRSGTPGSVASDDSALGRFSLGTPVSLIVKDEGDQTDEVEHAPRSSKY